LPSHSNDTGQNSAVFVTIGPVVPAWQVDVVSQMLFNSSNNSKRPDIGQE
jgi:hypothetical protein